VPPLNRSNRGSNPFRLIVGISGASGVIYAVRLLELLKPDRAIETHLVISPAGRETISIETDWKPAEVERLANVSYRHADVAAAISSGSFPIDAMIVVPCSMGALSAIALSSSDNLLERAADVTLKERRRLVLVPRDAPFHLGHLRLMEQVTEMGGIVCPPMPAFYQRPRSVEELVDHTVSRLLDLVGIALDPEIAPRWNGPKSASRRKTQRNV
jgi:4-hydroxy-3-polyprenylbenzoate decarboxylase